ncbi:MAG: hypothetical protein ACHQK8_06990 [Bacteroidia bacterium]
MHKLDRTAFKIQTFEEADDEGAYWNSLTVSERLEVAWELTCITYRINPENPPKFDRNFFEIVKQKQN